jgi:protein SEY1
LVGFKQALTDGLRGEDYSFADVVGKAREQYEGEFTKGAQEARVEDTNEWGWEEELGLLQEEISRVADQCRKDETKKMVNAIEVCVILSRL